MGHLWTLFFFADVSSLIWPHKLTIFIRSIGSDFNRHSWSLTISVFFLRESALHALLSLSLSSPEKSNVLFSPDGLFPLPHPLTFVSPVLQVFFFLMFRSPSLEWPSSIHSRRQRERETEWDEETPPPLPSPPHPHPRWIIITFSLSPSSIWLGREDGQAHGKKEAPSQCT